MEKLQMYYPESDLMPGAIDFATLGFTGPTALNESTFATGQQQRADNIYAETTFVCPSYWLAEAYTGNGRTAYKYQFSVVPAEHGDDISVFFPTSGLAPLGPEYSSDFVTAALSIWGNFVMYNSPIISAATANGANSSSTNSGDAVAAWPQWTSMNPIMLNLNETGGSVVSIPLTTSQNITVDVDPGLTNDFSLVQAYPWEGGRGYRCDYWQSVGGIVPE
ncbi:MAG: hypothetical protein M1819_007320 [Sarea resinae]|nr:MAG: hypothetical protein M1819_007320 [Sarea resinae]